MIDAETDNESDRDAASRNTGNQDTHARNCCISLAKTVSHSPTADENGGDFAAQH